MVSFELGAQEYALPLDRVREIIPLPDQVSEIPRSETAVLGVVTLRDRLLPLVSLRALLGLPSDPHRGERGKVVVLSMGSGAVGMVADRDPGNHPRRSRLDRSGAGAAHARRRGRRDHVDLPPRPRQAPGRRAFARPAVPVRTGAPRACRSRVTGAVIWSGQPDGSAMAEEQFVIFRLGDQEYGLPIAAVDEIARPPDHISRLPKAPAFIDGVMNFRGSVVPIVDLRRRFELAPKELGNARRILVLALGGGKTGFMVDSVSEVMRVPLDAIRPAPELSPEQMRLIGRVANLEARRPNDPAGRSGAAARSGRGRRSRQVRPGRPRSRIEGFVIRLLIADDSALMRKLLEGIFREEGDFDIRLARNGNEALELVRSFDPQVVTLDVQMPGMDGLTCLGQIMIEAPRPVVMISALTEEGAEATLEADRTRRGRFHRQAERDRFAGDRPAAARCWWRRCEAAAKARIRRTLRLAERIRHQFRGAGCSAAPAATAARVGERQARPTRRWDWC